MKNSVRIVLFASAFGVLLGAVSVPAQNKIRELKNRMDTHNKALTTLRATVTMVTQNAQLRDDPTLIVGQVMYAKRKDKDKSALVRLDWLRPKESISVKDDIYVMYSAARNIAYKGSVASVKGKKYGNSMFVFMNLTKAQLDSDYDVELLSDNATLSSGVRTIHLKLVPKAAAEYKIAEIWVDVDGMPVQTKIIHKNDDTTTMLLTKLQKNVNLKSSEFDIDLPRGTKIEKN